MGRNETQIMMYNKKNILRVLTKLFTLKSKKWLTKQSARKKNCLVQIKDLVKKIKKKLNMKKQKIRDETLKTYIDSKEI